MINKVFLLMIFAISTSAQAFNLEMIMKGPSGRNYWKITCRGGAVGRCSGLEDFCNNRAANWCGETNRSNSGSNNGTYGSTSGTYGSNNGTYGSNNGAYGSYGGTYRSNTAPRSILPPLLNSRANTIRK